MRYVALLVALALAGGACGATPEPSLDDQAGLVDAWAYLNPNDGELADVVAHDVPAGHVPETPGVLNARDPAARDLVVVWSTAPCRTGPRLTVEASSTVLDLQLDVGAMPSGIGVDCPAALVGHGLRLELSEDLGLREVQLTVTHGEGSDETWSSTQAPSTMPPLPAGLEPSVRLELPDFAGVTTDPELGDDPERDCALVRALPDEIDEQGAVGPYETSEQALRAVLGAVSEDVLPRSGWAPLRPRFTHETHWYVLNDREHLVAAVTTTQTRDGWYTLSAAHCMTDDQ